jgi:hypothetical protein
MADKTPSEAVEAVDISGTIEAVRQAALAAKGKLEVAREQYRQAVTLLHGFVGAGIVTGEAADQIMADFPKRTRKAKGDTTDSDES